MLGTDPADVALSLRKRVGDGLEETPVLLEPEMLLESVLEAVDAHGEAAHRLAGRGGGIELPDAPLELIEVELNDLVLLERLLGQLGEGR